MATSLYKWLCIGVLTIISVPIKATRLHPLYITVTEINQNAKDHTLEISCKIFTNDFETALEKSGIPKVDLSDAKNKPAADKAIPAYIQKKLLIQVDGKPVQLEYVGFEKETDATWCYFQVNNITAVKKLELTNTILYDVFEQEINIIHVTLNGERKSTRLTNPDAHALFEN